MKLHISPATTEVLRELADYFVATAQQAIAAQGRFTVALSGGSSPKKLYELLASEAYKDQLDWTKVYFFFGDERNVPHTDPQSNYLMAKTALFEPLQIDAAQTFPVDTSLPPVQAAVAYTKAINQHFGNENARFDLVLLGLGDNSHTASLFPHTPVLHDDSVGAKEVYVEELQADRITLTAQLINQAQAIAFLVFGADKAEAVKHILEDSRNIEEYPAQLIEPTSGEIHWFLDAAAAARLERQ
ncbi:6-phosphogluconolactonase [Hymenobacter sp. BT186]|uniref:6-phosphogluconolactonase n=1 Tax=Hymenobacter telluris TaxID=2816474 RepID=A0A939EXS4_9BACT|nr:6-phosphogluconolactonase [Hymenobacter telluris]MBO0359116.1 6-phosphogluconolactonase [Hymenobacter telluris]MBW3375142.1 6-phosphogluconolactonase [Hymenobacter norwichensis]